MSVLNNDKLILNNLKLAQEETTRMLKESHKLMDSDPEKYKDLNRKVTGLLSDMITIKHQVDALSQPIMQSNMSSPSEFKGGGVSNIARSEMSDDDWSEG